MIEILNAYRNPVFGILSLLFIVAFVFFIDFLKRKYNDKRKQEFINKLEEKFDNLNAQHNIDKFIKHATNATQIIITIAQTYAKVGDYEQTIAICKILIEKSTKQYEKLEILELLGGTYNKAGLFEQAKNIFLEILHYYPHNIRILECYIVTCENLKHYTEALTALGCLEEIVYYNQTHNYNMQKIEHTKNYLKVIQLCSDYKVALKEQEKQLLAIYEKDSTLHKMILRHFSMYNIDLFWQKILEQNNIMPYVDILWNLKKHEVPFELIYTHKDLLAIYYAKGFINGYEKSDNFTLEVLQLLNMHSHIKADITFTYRCNACNMQTPFYVYRCPVCTEVATIEQIITPSQL